MHAARLALATALLLLAGACSSSTDEPASQAAVEQSSATTATSPTTAAPTTVPPTTEPAGAEEGTASTNSVPNHPDALDESEALPTCAESGQFTATLAVGGAKREVQIFIPSSATEDAALPMVVNWHGLGSTGPDQAGFTAYEELAETEGFIVVHPTGDPGIAGRNNWEFGALDDPTKDDVAYANALLDAMIEKSCADAQRIYSTGMSNGGLFTASLVCELADRFAAAASVAGVSHPDDCSPARPVPFIAFHGTDDEVVTFDGSTGGGALFSEVMPDEFAEFAADFGCTEEPVVVDLADDVVRYDYQGCEDDVPLSFYEITDGGHTWPNSPLAAFVEGSLGRTTESVDATADAWAFFEQHTLS